MPAIARNLQYVIDTLVIVDPDDEHPVCRESTKRIVRVVESLNAVLER
jgi:hypothetical protein